tara:strand:+ start:341 stop:1090 length:750 start_codon:yes stop_codon:yes gene_type:complete
MEEKIYFNTKSEKNDRFFTEYHPPNPGWKFSTLSINYINEVSSEQAVKDLEDQSKQWTNKYPVSLMASAFDLNGYLIDLCEEKPASHLIIILKDGDSVSSWELQGDDEFPDIDIDEQLEIFKDIGFKTQSEINHNSDLRVKSMKKFKLLILFWAVVIPLIISILEFFSPEWVGVLALGYSFWRAYKQWRIMTGRDEKSEKEKAKEKEERTMRHHHYHCELNPEGFLKLKCENLKASLSEEVQKKYSEIE